MPKISAHNLFSPPRLLNSPKVCYGKCIFVQFIVERQLSDFDFDGNVFKF